MQFIELFAGCGGLSLGLKSVGFNLTMANELSPMAAESYAFNFLNEDLSNLSESSKKPDKTLWLSSSYPIDKLGNRMRENPFQYPNIEQGYSDIKKSGSNLDGALVIGSIITLNKWLASHKSALNRIKTSFGRGAVDLVSGGPPCQSFSMAGLRQKDNEKNSLPWEFAKFVESIQPKFVLLENVTGILRPFTGSDGSRYYAWFELAKAFSQIGYVPLCLHINAKYAGVPQNRPRFVLLGIRFDIFQTLKNTFNKCESILFDEPENFYHSALKNNDLPMSSLNYRDITRSEDRLLIASSFLKPIFSTKEFISVKSAIDDLKSSSKKSSKYSNDLEKLFSNIVSYKGLKNHELRTNNELVKRRFRIYQILEVHPKEVKKAVLGVMKGSLVDIPNEAWSTLKNEQFLMLNGKFGVFTSKAELLEFLKLHTTKKQTQKALSEDFPAPAALSIPDDACHYDLNHLRTLTVREMARIQSFPDSFVFRSKVTTGGQMRRFEVPQYTQVGNAVPPLLGRALGLSIAELIKRLPTSSDQSITTK